MNLRSKKELAARTFRVGKERIIFVKERLDEIKEAITKQDMVGLKKDGAIKIKEIKGRTTVKRNKSRSPGNIRKKVNKSKKEYVTITRKLRKHVKHLKMSGELGPEEVKEIRKRIRNKNFKSKAHMKDYLGQKNKFFAASSGNKKGSKKKTNKVKRKKK